MPLCVSLCVRSVTKISEEYNVAVYITNQVTADPGGGMTFQAGPKPVGGNILAHSSTLRMMFKKGRGDARIAKICDRHDSPLPSPPTPHSTPLLHTTQLLLMHTVMLLPT